MSFLNPFTLKKYIALALPGIICTVTYVVMLMFKGQIYAVLGYVGALVITVLIGSMLLMNPFQDMLEGSGILALNIDSTGIISPFILRVDTPYLKGKVGNRNMQDVFDRSTVMQLANPSWKDGILKYFKRGDPLEASIDGPAAVADENGVTIHLTESKYNQARFAMFHYPVIIYNAQIKSILTKDFLSDMEKDTFAEHSIMYLNRKLEELSTSIRDFGRYIVDLTHREEKGGLFSNWWVWLILGILLIIIIALFGPSILAAIKGPAASAVSSATQTIKGTQIPGMTPVVVQT